MTGEGGLKLCRGYNVSEYIIDPNTIDGRYGGNDTDMQYGGNIAMANGMDVVYGFHGEFWKGVEANQFLHFRDGLFVGQFGVPNHGLMSHCGVPTDSNWGFPGHAGNAFSPVLVDGRSDDEMYMYHNDESSHGGVARWRIYGLSTITQYTNSSAGGGSAAACAAALSKACDRARRASAGNCFQCTGAHQHELQLAKCTEADLDKFCGMACADPKK